MQTSTFTVIQTTPPNRVPRHQEDAIDTFLSLVKERMLDIIATRKEPIMSLEEAMLISKQERLDIKKAMCRNNPFKAKEEHLDYLAWGGVGYVDCSLLMVSYDGNQPS